MDADVDAIGINDDDDDDDDGIFSIANDRQSEDDDTSLVKTTFVQQCTRSALLLTRMKQQKNFC
uniref:Uncharacterized protein n=1 Tax=Peronospora matthiolae TaxID=2874970 RepID=A0AAV1U8I9_9STRA